MVEYAKEESIRNMIKFTGDTSSDDAIKEAASNGNIFIKSKLKSYRIDEPATAPETLIKAANYYAISDILQIMHINNPKDRSENEKGFLEKAESFVCDYIKEILDEKKEEEAKKNHPYRVSQTPSKIGRIFR